MAKVAAEGSDFLTKEKSGGFVVTSAQGQGLVVAEFVLAIGTKRYDTCLIKPITWGGNFSIVAA